MIRADANPILGMGHVYCALAITQEMASHRPVIVGDSSSTASASKTRFAQTSNSCPR
jgi:hypothetical protein